MNNQASEDEQIDDVLTNAIDYYISGNGVQPEAISRIKSLIRTEKLKLLAEVKSSLTQMKELKENRDEEGFLWGGYDVVDLDDIRELLTKLEAEL